MRPASPEGAQTAGRDAAPAVNRKRPPQTARITPFGVRGQHAIRARTGKQVMPHIRSTALAAISAVTALAGHVAPASAQAVNAPSAKMYVQSTGPGEQPATASALGGGIGST